MSQSLSPRLASVIDALPLKKGIRVLEIGCGPGAAARAIAHRIGEGHVLGIDRSARAIELARAACADELTSGRMSLRCVAVEELELLSGERPFDLAFAVRVGVLDGRHPERAARAHQRISAALAPRGRLYVGDGADMRRVTLT
jgi:SAM-dependent methyltransferase